MITIRYTRNLFLRSICAIYLAIFLSFYIQIPGLYGDNGVLPAKALLENSKHKTLSAKVHYQPTLLWLAPYVGLDTNYALDVLALLGTFLAFTGLVSQKFCTIPLFAGLWSLYFSLYQVGQVFVTTQWDELMLEAGFLCLLVAPLLPKRLKLSKSSPSDRISFWLVRWLLFRFVLSTGLTKLISGCPKWWDLNALGYYFQSMVIPSPLSWYAYHLPSWVLRLTTVLIHVSEIAMPFLFFVPIRSVRITGFVVQMFIQIATALTGNHCILSVLWVALLFSLLDDKFFFSRKKSTIGVRFMNALINLGVHAALVVAVVVLYNVQWNGDHIDVIMGITKEQFDLALKQGILLARYIGFVSLAITILRSFASAMNDSHLSTKVLAFISTIFYGGLAFILFTGSTVPLASLHKSTNSSIEPLPRSIYNRLHKLHAINEYGLFKKMTGVNGRLEIILEGSNNLEGPWQEFDFLYKPGNVNQSLPFTGIYSPRLDWQMWWAAQSKYDKEPWLLSLAHRILEGVPEVMSLLKTSPFGDKPPKYLRGSLYNYKYTSWNERNTQTTWRREKVGDYFPAYSKTSPALVDYLMARNLLPTQSKQHVHAMWKTILDYLRHLSGRIEATVLLISMFSAALLLINTNTNSASSASTTKGRN